MPPVIDLWGGIECTVNRIADQYFDQFEKNGHSDRPEDLQLIADLGIRTIRYPALWEKIAPDSITDLDWQWTDSRLKLLQELNICPIIGLLHHGSGPKYTSLIDPEFPEKFAFFALEFAKRYPWVEFYTPINEPLTTARFSCLYGHWYPHHDNDQSFAYAFINQCKAIKLSMEAIRTINPKAKLVQTEEIGKIFSTPKLNYQAEFENERRWLTYDILAGKFNEDSYLWPYFKKLGFNSLIFKEFSDSPCPPDILGVNHYVTSERFIDHRINYYPEYLHGGNNREAYADVEAIRVYLNEELCLKNKLREAWQRYNIPISITEAHLGCTADEQMRWLKEIWDISIDLKLEGVNIKAVTNWALFGSYNWNSLLTKDTDHYESGAFKMVNNKPEPTIIANLLKSLINDDKLDEAIFDSPGWWHKPDRIIYRHTMDDYMTTTSRKLVPRS